MHFVCYRTISLLHSHSVYALTAIYFAKLGDFKETFRFKMWPKIKRPLVLGLDVGFL